MTHYKQGVTVAVIENASTLPIAIWSRRIGAFLIDTVIQLAVGFWLMESIGRLLAVYYHWPHHHVFMVLQPWMPLIMAVKRAFYNVGFEASPLQATFGKWMCGLMVTNMHDGKAGLFQLLKRWGVKELSLLCWGLGLFTVLFLPERQTAYDWFAHTQVKRANR